MGKKGNEFRVLVDGEYYRVATLTRITKLGSRIEDMEIEHEDLGAGLAIEQRISGDPDHYIVISIFRYDKDEKQLSVEDVACRSIDILEYKDKGTNEYFKRIQEYYNCAKFIEEVFNQLFDSKNDEDIEDDEGTEDDEERGYIITEGDRRFFVYKGFEVEILSDDDGQQFYFIFDGKEYSCGAFNPYPEDDIRFVIDEALRKGMKGDKKNEA